MRARIAHGGLGALALVAGIIVPASGALAAAPHTARGGGIGVRLVAAPGGSIPNALARSFIVERLAPGGRIRRRVEISNTTRSTGDVSVYAGGASLDRGEFAFAPGHSQNELSGWTSVSRDALRLPPGGTAYETVTIKVPRQAPSGERYAVVWAEVSAPAPAGGGITVVNRVGVRMYVSIGPGGAPPPSFTIGPLTARRSAAGEPFVVASIRNSGRGTLDISGSLTLSGGPDGLRAGPFPVTLGTPLAPGKSEPATVELDKRLPRGPWHAHMRLTSGSLQRTAAATLTFPGRTSTVTGSGHRVLAIAILLALLAIGAVALLLSRRARTPGSDVKWRGAAAPRWD